MSTATVLTVPITQAAYDRLNCRASERNRSVADLLEEALRQAEERHEAFRRMGEAMASMQAQSILNGTSEMTMDEINEEIALARRERAEAETWPLSRDIYERMKRRAQDENRTVTDVVEDAILEAEAAREERREAFRRMGDAVRFLQEQSIVNGTSTMTMDEINEEIAAMHAEEGTELRRSA